MAHPSVCDAVEEYLAAEWDHDDYPLVLPNTQKAPPKAITPYVKVDYPLSDPRQASIGSPGSNLWREEGVFRVLIMSPRGKGAGASRLLSAEIAELFRGKRIDEFLQCWAPNVVNDPDGDEASYFVTAVAVEYWADIIG